MSSRGPEIWGRVIRSGTLPVQHEGDQPNLGLIRVTLLISPMQLNSIDNMRVDGKFIVGQDIPEGQGSINALLAECFDLAYDLRVEAEQHDSDDD